MDEDCGKCKVLEDSNGMELDRDTCTHKLHCTNCSTETHIFDKNHTADARRCPICLEKYGTACSNEQKALKSNNPWKVVNTKKPRKPRTTNPTSQAAQKVPPEQLACQNQFSIFEDPNPTTYIEEDMPNQ